MKYLKYGLAAMLTFLILCVMPVMAIAQNAKTYIHPRAINLMPTIKKEVSVHHPNLTIPWYYPGLMEHESCIHLKHSRCWNSEARLKNEREEGIGVAQLSRAWDKNGRLRFDNLQEYRRKYPKELWELDWSTFRNRVDLQVRVAVLMVRDLEKNFYSVESETERMKMVDSAYNGGASHVKRAREACQLSRGCNPHIWYRNVENHIPKSRAPDSRYGGRSMYAINTGHVKDVFETRMPKFKTYFED